MAAKSDTQVAIVGAGYIADTHLQVLAKTPGTRVTAIVDPVLERAQSVAVRFGIPHAFASVEELLGHEPPVAEVAHLLVPPPLHARLTRQLLEGGVSVLVEKPFALHTDDVDSLDALARRQGLVLGVNHNNLFHPTYLHLREVLASGRLGRIEQVFVCLHVPLRQLDTGDFRHWMFQHPRNIVFEQGPHPFSQLVGLLGPLRSMSCQRSGARDLGNGRIFYDTWQIGAECERGPATVLLSFGKGFAENWIHVIGSDGAFRVDLLREHTGRWSKTPWMDFVDQGIQSVGNSLRSLGSGIAGAFRYVTSTLKLRQRADVFYVGMAGSLRNFHAAVAAGRVPACDATHARHVLEYCEAATQDLSVEPPAPRRVAAPIAAPRQEVGREVLVTGATGFLGRFLIERLCAEAVEVRVLVRDPANLPAQWRDLDLRIVEGSIEDVQAVGRAVRGARAVYHLATGTGSTIEELRGSMVAGCKNIAEACLEHSVPRFFFTSSIAAAYLGGGGEPLAENTPPDPKAHLRSPYARAKAECEQWLTRMHRERQLPVVIFRPGVVVGRGGLIQHSGVGLWTKDSECFGWGMGRHPLPFVLAVEVVDAMLRGLYAKGIEGQTFHLVGDAGVSARSYVRELQRRTGRRFRFHPHPLLVLQTVEIFKWAVKRAIGRKDASWPAYRDLRSRALTRRLDNTLAKRQLAGWMPVADRDAFFQRAIDWYAEQLDAPRQLEPVAPGASAPPDLAVPSTPRPAQPVSPDR